MTDRMSNRTQHARRGYRWYSVSTPQVFVEYELPENDERMTRKERKQMDWLEQEASNHRTYVSSSHYRLG